MLQIVLNGTSCRLRKQALRDNRMTLQQLLLLGRQDEMSRFQAADIEGKEAEDINFIHRRKGFTQRKTSHKSARAKQCNNCGGEWPHQDGPCPASGQTCRNCKKLNHFARMCRSKAKHGKTATPSASVRPLDITGNTSSDSEIEYCYALETKPKGLFIWRRVSRLAEFPG